MDPNLYKAAKEGNIEAFKKTNESEFQLHRLLTPEKNTVLHIHITSSTTDETFFVEEILNLYPALLRRANNSGDIPLHVAARYGQERIVKLLIARAKADHHDNDIESGKEAAKAMVRTRNFDKDTALHEAVRFGHVEVVRVLVDEDCSGLHEYYVANKDGETPLYMAAERKHEQLVSLMLEKCSLPLATGGPRGRTVLHAAVISNSAEKILERMGHLTKHVDDRGWVPLHFAVHLNFMPIAKDLLRKDKNAAYIKDKKGRIPLHLAASNGNHEMMSEILSSCPDCGELVDHRRWNALHFAVNSNSILAVKVILNNPALSNLLNGKDFKGNTPLHVATRLGFIEIQEALISLTRGVDKMAVNKENQNAYDIAMTVEGNRDLLLERLRAENVLIGTRILIDEEREDLEAQIVPSKEKESQTEKTYEARENLKDSFNFEKYQQSSLVAATIIATMTFAAGFTMPGGYVSSDDDNVPLRGTAVMRQNTAFQAFIIADTIAMVLSSISVLIQLFINVREDEEGKRIYLAMAYLLTMVSMMALVMAFITGTFAVLAPSLALAVATCVICLSFFVFWFGLCWRTIIYPPVVDEV